MYHFIENMKAIIRRWTSALFTEEVKAKLALNERQVFQAATLQELDDVYTRKLAGFESVSGEK
jgi:predicted alpha/beta-fold hydrolase